MSKIKNQIKTLSIITMLVALLFTVLGCATKGEKLAGSSPLKINPLTQKINLNLKKCIISPTGNGNVINKNFCSSSSKPMVKGDKNVLVDNKIYGNITIIGNNNIIQNSVIKANITINGDNVKIINEVIE